MLWLLGDAFEEVGGLVGRLGDDGGGQEVVLLLAVFADGRLGLEHERGLRGVGGEGFLLAIEDSVDVEGNGPRGCCGDVAVGEEEVCRDVIEALGCEERTEFEVAFGVAGPVEGGGGDRRDYGVVGMGVQGTVAAEGEDDVRTEGADALDDFARELREVREFQLAVLVVEDFVVLDAEDAAGSGELGTAELAELLVGFGVTAVAAGGAGGEAEGGDFDAAIGGKGEGATKGEAFVVGVGEDAEKAVTHSDGGPQRQFSS